MNDRCSRGAVADLSGRVALVAGASKGIGAATAEAFAAAGAAVVLAARDTTALKAVADGIEARGGRALAVGADVTDVGSMRHVVDQALSAFGRLDAAFNNASAGPLPSAARGHRPGRVRPRHRHQHPRHLPRDEVPDPGHAGERRRRDREHGLHRRAERHRQPRGVRRGQGRDHRPDQGGRAGLRRPGHPGQRGGAGPDPDLPPRGGGPAGTARRRAVHADAARRHRRRGGAGRALAVLGPVLVHHRDRHADRRRAGRGQQAAADVPARASRCRIVRPSPPRRTRGFRGRGRRCRTGCLRCRPAR